MMPTNMEETMSSILLVGLSWQIYVLKAIIGPKMARALYESEVNPWIRMRMPGLSTQGNLIFIQVSIHKLPSHTIMVMMIEER